MRESNKRVPVSYPYRKSITNIDFPDAIFIFSGNQTYRPLPGYSWIRGIVKVLKPSSSLLRNQTSNTSGGVYENILKRQEVVHAADWSVTLCLDSEVLVQGYT